MKLLGWMHKKFWPSGIEPLKDFTIANSCVCLSVQAVVDDEDIYLKPGFGSRALQPHNQDYEKTSSEVETKNVMEASGNVFASSDFFHGFLTIGTLGSEPATPTFSMAFEDIIERPSEVTEDDLKLINYEIGKFLEAETKEDLCDESQGRTSHASIITLAGKNTEGTEEENDGKALTCPLQGYLFGSTVELPDKMMDSKSEKTPSLELFQRTVNENSRDNVEKEVINIKHSNKSAASFVKKVLKKLYSSSHGSSTNEAGDSYPTKKKLQKVLRLFHKKIHPENSTAANEYQVKNVCSETNYYIGNEKNLAGNVSKEEMHYCKANLGLFGVDGNVSSANKGHWIKTDADYLVLEL